MRYGAEAVSFQGLKQGMRIWFEGRDACVAYTDTGSAWVAAGSPLAAEDDVARVAQAFCAAAAKAGRRASFFGTERDDSSTPGMSAMVVGEQPIWTPLHWACTLRRSRSLREQLRRAKVKGVAVRPCDPSHDEGASDRSDILRLMRTWLAQRGMAPMGFVVDPQPFVRSREQRYWVAEQRGRAVGALVAVPIPARSGWMVEQIYRDERAPNGTTESLIHAAMQTWAAEGAQVVTLGLAPLSEHSPPWMRWLGRLAPWLYDFEGLRAFKTRMRPDHWEPVYHAHPVSAFRPLVVLDGLTAFARGSLMGFGVRSLLKHPTALAIWMVAWVIALGVLAWLIAR